MTLQQAQDKIGPGIPGVITPAEIFDAVGVYKVGFCFNADTKKWTLLDDIPAGTTTYPDLVVDLEHSMDLSSDDSYYRENYTISDYIADKMVEREDDLREEQQIEEEVAA